MPPPSSPYYLVHTTTDNMYKSSNFTMLYPGIYQTDFTVTICLESECRDDRLLLYRDKDCLAAFDLHKGQIHSQTYVVETGPNYEGCYFKLEFQAFQWGAGDTYTISCPILTIIRCSNGVQAQAHL